MYAIVEDNNITQYINNPKSVVIGDVRYPAKIFEIWSQSEKEAIGIYEIVVDKTNYKDPEYYMNTAPSYSFADGQVKESWGTATAKQLDDSFWTQSEIDALENAGDLEAGDLKVEGLKTQKKKNIKKEASALLTPTDWYVVKATEVADYNVPSNVSTFRTNVRTKSNEMETQINNCANVDQLKALYTYTEQEDGTVTRPLAEFPEGI